QVRAALHRVARAVVVAAVGEDVRDQERPVGRQRLEHGDEDARREGRYGDVRKQVVDVGELPGGGPLRGGHRPQLLDGTVREGDAVVPAERLDDVQVVVLERVERRRVGRLDVVTLEESLDQDL